MYRKLNPKQESKYNIKYENNNSNFHQSVNSLERNTERKGFAVILNE